MLNGSNNNLLILGAGGHGKIVADCAKESGEYKEIAFLDDGKKGQTVIGLPVLGTFAESIKLKSEFSHTFIALGNNKLRVELIDRMLEQGYSVPILKHPFAVVSKYAKIGIGSLIAAGAIINADTQIGKGCIVNTGTSIDHDCVLGYGVHISPGARLGGMVSIGDYTWVCIGANIANSINIGSNSIVAAGAAVLSDVGDNVMVAGLPARVNKEI